MPLPPDAVASPSDPNVFFFPMTELPSTDDLGDYDGSTDYYRFREAGDSYVEPRRVAQGNIEKEEPFVGVEPTGITDFYL